MGEALITRRGGGGGGLDGIASGSTVVCVGWQVSTTTGMESQPYYRGCIQFKRYGSEKIGYVCWHEEGYSFSAATKAHVALIDWENKTVTQIVQNGAYPYQPSYGFNFNGVTCTMAVYASEWDGEEVSVMYLSEQ